MSSTDELAAETRKADVNLHRFISDDRWQRIHDDSARSESSIQIGRAEEIANEPIGLHVKS